MATTVDSIVSIINSSATDGEGVTTGEPGGAGGLANPVWASVLIGLFCSLMIVGTVVGNILVCTAVSIVRKLRTPSNWLIVSLAVADLLVAVLVMPLAIVHEVCIHCCHRTCVIYWIVKVRIRSDRNVTKAP